MSFCVYCGAALSGAFCTECGGKQPTGKVKARRPKFKFKPVPVLLSIAVLVAIGLGLNSFVAQYIAPFGGPMSVSISSTPGGNSLNVAFYELELNNTKIVLPRNGYKLVEVGFWSSEEPIYLTIKSQLIGEKDLTLSYLPREYGLLGKDDGRAVRVDIEVDSKAISATLSISSSDLEDNWTEIRSGSITRENFSALAAECAAEIARPAAQASQFAQGLYTQYSNAVKRAKLEGEMSLYYTTWASRADTLQRYLRDIEDDAPFYSGNFGEEEWQAVLRSFGAIIDAWENLESVARREADNSWDSAWGRINNAEYILMSTPDQFSSALSGPAVAKLCRDRLLRD